MLLGMQRRALDEWWNHNDDLPDYFLYHRIFEVLQVMVPEVRGQWDAAPPLSATSAHLLQLEMMQPWRPNTLADIDAVAPLQKLSYKYDTVPEARCSSASSPRTTRPRRQTRPVRRQVAGAGRWSTHLSAYAAIRRRSRPTTSALEE